MEEIAGEQRDELGVELAHEIVALLIGGGQHVPVRHFRKLVVFFVLQDVVQMPERLLLGNEIDVKLPRVCDELLYFLSGKSASFGTDQGMVLIVEHMFDVERPDVHLVFGRPPYLAPDEFRFGNGAAADVIVQASIAHGRPVPDLNAGNRIAAAALRHDHLAQRLHAVKQPRVGLAQDRNLVSRNVKEVSLRILNFRNRHFPRF